MTANAGAGQPHLSGEGHAVAEHVRADLGARYPQGDAAGVVDAGVSEPQPAANMAGPHAHLAAHSHLGERNSATDRAAFGGQGWLPGGSGQLCAGEGDLAGNLGVGQADLAFPYLQPGTVQVAERGPVQVHRDAARIAQLRARQGEVPAQPGPDEAQFPLGLESFDAPHAAVNCQPAAAEGVPAWMVQPAPARSRLPLIRAWRSLVSPSTTMRLPGIFRR